MNRRDARILVRVAPRQIVFGHVTARNRPWAVRNGAKIRVHRTSWMDPVRCRGDVTCVCLQSCEHARHVLSEEARRGEERRGGTRRGEERREKSGEGKGRRGRQARRDRQVSTVPPFYRLPPCSEIDSAGAGINDRDRGSDEDHGDEQ